jgi:hypothetical protein
MRKNALTKWGVLGRKCSYFSPLLLLIFFVLVVNSEEETTGSSAFDFGSWAQSFVSKTSKHLKKFAVAVTDKLNGKKKCLYRKSASKYVEKKLHARLKAQEMAVASIVSSIRSWEFDRSAERRDRSASFSRGKPLVLAFTGPTGVGKTETSNLIAEALLSERETIRNSVRKAPVGFLKFNGGDFNDYVTKPLKEYHDIIRTRLFQHFYDCNGIGVVLFDEVQKVIPGTLDVLKNILSGRPQLDFVDRNNKATTVYCDNAVFIFVSDIGAEAMTELVVEHGGRGKVPEHVLNRNVRKAMNLQWRRLNFEGLVDMVVPFLPFEPMHIREIMKLKTDELHAEHAGTWWKKLAVHDDAISYMSKQRFIAYTRVVLKVKGDKKTVPKETGEGDPSTKQENYALKFRYFAKYGARIDNGGGPLHILRGKLFRYLEYDEEEKNVHTIHVKMSTPNEVLAIFQCQNNDRAGGGAGDPVEESCGNNGASEEQVCSDVGEGADLSECKKLWEGPLGAYT